jgi:putative cofactor-binding repeat protein/VCBS repeat-containing protein
VLANDTDPEGQPMTAAIETGPAHAASFSLAANGSFSYVPAADYAGIDSFTYRAHDGIQPSAPATVTITVSAVNDAPVNQVPSSLTIAEDTAYTFPAGSFSVSDVDSGSSDVSTHLTIAGATVTAGTSGVTVTGNGTGDVTVAGPVAAVSAAVDGLTVTPAPGTSGATTLTVVTNDSGHTGSGGALTDTDTVAITVAAVNDAPSFTQGADQSVAEDAGAQTVSGWATAIDKGAPNESGQTLTFDVTNDNAALFQTAPAVSASGTLTYVPAPDASGTATVTVVLHDNGGTANGGDDTSDPATFTITVTPVNDPPTAAAQSYAVHTNMRLHVTGLLTGASDAHDAAAYTPSFTLESVTPASCAGCGISNVASDGSFDFDPPAGATGSYTLSYTVRDGGHPAPGEVSAPATITMTIAGPVIWFVDPAVAGPGTGTLADPFKTLASAAAVSGAGQKVFVSSGTVTGSVTQAAGEWLVGQGVTGTSFDSVMGVTPPPGTIARPAVNGTRPTVNGGVTLADNSVVRGIDLAPASGTTALAGNGADGVTVGEVSATGTSARAVDLQASQGSTVSLTRVSATGSPNGAIRLVTVNTTTPGSFAVTGTGSSGSGGTISGGAGSGVALQSVKDVSLAWMTISASGGDGVSGSGVTNYAMTDSTVSGAGTHGMSFANLLGTSSLTRVTVSGSGIDNTRVMNTSGSATLTVTNSSFRDNNATTGGNGLYVDASGTASMAFTSATSSYLRNRTDGLAVFGQSSGTTSATVTGNTFVTDAGVGLDLESNGTGPMTYAVSGGTAVGCASCSAPVVVYKATGATGTGTSAMAGSISGMTIDNGGSGGAPGIWVHAEGAGASRIAITGNSISNVAHNGILVSAGNGSNAMDTTITGNTVDLTLAGAGALSGIQVDSGTLTADTTKVCADIRTNTVVNPLANDVNVRNRRAGSTFRLPGYAGGATDTAAVVNFLKAQNTILDGAASVGTSPGFAGGAACAAP